MHRRAIHPAFTRGIGPAALRGGVFIFLMVNLSADSHPEKGLEARLERAVRHQVMQGFSQANLAGELVAIHLPPNIRGLDPRSDIEPLRTFVPKKAAGRSVVPMAVTPAGGQPVKINITIETVAVVKGWTTNLPLKRGSRLRPQQFERRTIRVTRREQDYITSESLPEGYQLSTSLSPGQLLQFHHLELVPDVQRGEQVMIYFRRKHVTLVSPGKVRRSGLIGDIIPVVAAVTGKRLYGRLESPGIVVVEMKDDQP